MEAELKATSKKQGSPDKLDSLINEDEAGPTLNLSHVEPVTTHAKNQLTHQPSQVFRYKSNRTSDVETGIGDG